MKSNIFKIILLTIIIINANSKTLDTGKKVFEEYCWGCHHQTSLAFGPSFTQIANSRSKEQIITHIMSPKSDYKALGYKRSVMPSFGDTLKPKELELISNYILSFKSDK